MSKMQNLSIDINLLTEKFPRFQQAKDYVYQSVDSLTKSAQQVGESWKQTATSATDKAIDSVTTTVGQAKSSLEQSWQTADQIKNTTSRAVEVAIASSVNDWLTEHPAIFRIVQVLAWASNHPIISLVILVLMIAIASSIIKAIVRLIETASWSILQVPFKLLFALIKVSFFSFTKVSNIALKKLTSPQPVKNLPALPPATYPEIYKDKQQRLTEISMRLEAIQIEQKQLLQEATELLATDAIDMKKQDVNLG
ncbi:hypothetical protein NIES4075_49860 [Tolypothrix sp. NIES-4075]|uniref:hypothetical protein n=1 Tax=Tolypothrix sp. NIES-4075 TaxID=2005459 RepID=UPI000B73C6CC|nr:hypothetical protein NIES4075_49860 [Tolypothrix sp. NIES-4075]